MSLAIFDLDDTLTYQDTETLWLNFLVDNDYLDQEHVLRCQKKFLEDYQNGCLNFNDVISLSLSPIVSLTFKQQQSLQNSFKKQILSRYILPVGQRLINQHRAKGDHTLIISAGHEFLINPAVSFFNAHDVICTKLKKDSQSNAFLPIIDGSPVYKERKVIEYKIWLKENDYYFDKTYFYSDSINDLPLFLNVDIPIAVNPCPKLKTHALNEKWDVLDLKKDFSVTKLKV